MFKIIIGIAPAESENTNCFIYKKQCIICQEYYCNLLMTYHEHKLFKVSIIYNCTSNNHHSHTVKDNF